jgi:hypothetical protein
MNLSAVAKAGILFSVLSACTHPAMAQHRGAARPPAGIPPRRRTRATAGWAM